MVQHTHCASGAAECRDPGGEDFDDVEIVAGEEWLGGEPSDARQEVRPASGAVAVQLDHSIPAAVAALVARAAAEHRSLDEVADDVVHGRLVIAIRHGTEEQEGRTDPQRHLDAG